MEEEMGGSSREEVHRLHPPLPLGPTELQENMNQLNNPPLNHLKNHTPVTYSTGDQPPSGGPVLSWSTLQVTVG